MMELGLGLRVNHEQFAAPHSSRPDCAPGSLHVPLEDCSAACTARAGARPPPLPDLLAAQVRMFGSASSLFVVDAGVLKV